MESLERKIKLTPGPTLTYDERRVSVDSTSVSPEHPLAQWENTDSQEIGVDSCYRGLDPGCCLHSGHGNMTQYQSGILIWNRVILYVTSHCHGCWSIMTIC